MPLQRTQYVVGRVVRHWKRDKYGRETGHYVFGLCKCALPRVLGISLLQATRHRYKNMHAFIVQTLKLRQPWLVVPTKKISFRRGKTCLCQHRCSSVRRINVHSMEEGDAFTADPYQLIVSQPSAPNTQHTGHQLRRRLFSLCRNSATNRPVLQVVANAGLQQTHNESDR